MFNEVCSTPLHPSNVLPEWQQSQNDQNTPTGKKKRKNDTQSGKNDAQKEKGTIQLY